MQVEWWGGDLVDFQVVLVPSQVNANPSDSQVYTRGTDLSTTETEEWWTDFSVINKAEHVK